MKEWIDIFTRNEYKDVIVDSPTFCQKNKGLELFAWCIMTNHVHLIIRAKKGYTLQDIMRDFKKFTSKKIITAIKENPQESRKEWLLEKFLTKEGIHFWGTDNHPIELWSNSVISQKLDYLHNHPVEEGLVFRAEQYVYSSAVDYAGGKRLLDIILI